MSALSLGRVSDAPLTLSSLDTEQRIPHLESNSYIYQDASAPLSFNRGSDRYARLERPSPRVVDAELRHSIDRQIMDKELLIRRSQDSLSPEPNLEGRMMSLDLEIEQQLERSRVAEIEEKVQRRLTAEARERTKAIDRTIEERSRKESLKTIQSPARRITVIPIEAELQESYREPVKSGGRKRSKSAKRQRHNSKYEFISDKYSKFNTKSPYAKSTFCHDVRSMENQAYTYVRHNTTSRPKSRPKSVRGRGEEEIDYLRKVLALAESHAKRCPDLRIELARVRRQFGQAD